MISVGLKHTSEVVVSDSNTALAMGSGDMEVFATPSMVALMENAAMMAVASELSEDEATVGALINVTHDRPSKLGAVVKAVAELVEVDGRKLTFEVAASDENGMIGEGVHVRYVVGRERFLSKL